MRLGLDWRLFVLAILCVAAARDAAAGGQSQTQTTPGWSERAAMEKVAFIRGEWSGEGWIERAPGERVPFTLFEKYVPRLGGLIVDMEGVAKARIPPDNVETVVGRGLGFLYYDPGRAEYRMWHYDDAALLYVVAMDVDAPARTMQYLLDRGDGSKLRYRFSIDDKGVWRGVVETREKTTGTWREFMQYQLRRVDTPAGER